jgi:hypothetical protein
MSYYFNDHWRGIVESPFNLNPAHAMPPGDLEVFALGDDQEILATRRFTYYLDLFTSSVAPVIYAVTREPNNQLSLEVHPIEWDNEIHGLYDLRIAAITSELESNFDDLPRVALRQSQFLRHHGTWAQIIPGVISTLVTESIEDEEFYIGLKWRGQAWQPTELSRIWHCSGTACQWYRPAHQRITPDVQVIPSRNDQLQLVIHNDSSETLDLVDWEIWTGQEWLFTISQLNANSLSTPTDWGQTSIMPGDALVVNFTPPTMQGGNLVFYDQHRRPVLGLGFERDFDSPDTAIRYDVWFNYT